MIFPFFIFQKPTCSCKKSNDDISIFIENYKGKNHICIIPHTTEASKFISEIKLIKPKATLMPGCQHLADKLYINQNSSEIINTIQNSGLKIYLGDNVKNILKQSISSKYNKSIKNDSDFSKEEKLAIINEYLLKKFEVTEQIGFMETYYVVRDKINNKSDIIDTNFMDTF